MKEMIYAASLFSALSLITFPAFAEIEKIPTPCGDESCYIWWPKLPTIEGWHQDVSYSLYYGVNAQAPDGFTFRDADAAVYAKALYKPSMSDVDSLDDLMRQNKAQFSSSYPDIEITDMEALSTKDGQKLKSFAVFPKKSGGWKMISYGEEGDYYIVFTLNAHSKDDFTKALATYKKFINDYQEKP